MSSPENPKIVAEPSPEHGELPRLENIVFRLFPESRFKSSAPDRKIIEIHPTSANPIPGKKYTVEILQDTNPQDPMRGKYLARIILDKPQYTQDDWILAEDRVNAAEEGMRGARKAGGMIYEETGVPKQQRQGKTGEEVAAGSKRRRVTKIALQQEKIYDENAEFYLGGKDSADRQLMAFRMANIKEALKKEKEIERKKEVARKEEWELLGTLKPGEAGAGLIALRDVRRELELLDGEHKRLLTSNPEAFVSLHLKELKEYKKDLEKGRIVETAYVKEQAEDVAEHIHAHQPVLIYGHLGSGKTELAMHIANQYFEKPALVVSGSKFMSLAELYGHQILTLDKVNKEDIDQYTKEVEDAYNRWLDENRTRLANMKEPEREAEKTRAHDRILQVYLTQFKGGTVSAYFLGPIYRAMEEGRIVIIDEVNAIPHEVLISLNHILTRRVGERVPVQQDSGRVVDIKEGFGIIMTANLNQGQKKYVDRQEMDPAFLSRLYKKEYDYLPQTKTGTLDQNAGEENQLFQLLLAKVMDKNGGIEVPGAAIGELWNLAKVARVTEDVFAGKQSDASFYYKEGGSRATPYFLQESVLSMRALDRIIGAWQSDGYRYQLDHYIWKEFISQSTNASDRAYLYQLMKDVFGFFHSPWKQDPDYGTAGNIRSFEVPDVKNPSESLMYYGPRDVVSFAFGSIPERTKWPD